MTASTPIETQKPLVKDEEAADADVTAKTSHLQAVKRIFRYLKGQRKLGLWYPKVSSFNLEAYSDSDYAGANLERKSIIGEAEYVVAAHCCGQVLWIQTILITPHLTNMAVLEYCVKHNMIAYLEKIEENAQFHAIVDFLSRSSIFYALTVSPDVCASFIEQF
uniref:Uncharacterized protein n=1 Tax=Tanacetum cinerariifolium TaxID=118510 RepID=A0A6L2P7X1_TANCI|nr:hypothetical protein [Tanacetum cinerariifolium]